MNFPLSRTLAAATAVYGGYALAKPRHLGRLLTNNVTKQSSYDVLARIYGVRDLAVSTLGTTGRSEKTVTAAVLLRIVFDLSDGLILSATAEDKDSRTKLLGVTWAWAALNAIALLIDRRRA